MEETHDHAQRIGRLTPLGDVLADIDRAVVPVAPTRCTLGDAVGRVLAVDVVAPTRSPDRPVALRDGWAVRAEETMDAGSYAPAVLAAPPARIDTGDALPAAADAVAALDAIKLRAGAAEALAAVAPGDGVLPEGGDTEQNELLLPAGRALRLVDVAALRVLGIDHVMVRAPKVFVVTVRSDTVLDAISEFTAGAVTDAGATLAGRSAAADDLATALSAAGVDAIFVIGGTGTGRADDSVRRLAKLGRVIVHGIAVAPGETAAFGIAGMTPVLHMPGRLDAAVATWLTIGRHLIARLCGRGRDEVGRSGALTRKASSNLGLSEIVLVNRNGDNIEPLASGYLPLAALARAEGWIMIPDDSEGYPAGAGVEVETLP